MCRKLNSFLRQIAFEILFLYIYNCIYITLFTSPGTYVCATYVHTYMHMFTVYIMNYVYELCNLKSTVYTYIH